MEPIIQINGQMIYGPPESWTGGLPAKGSEIFVGKLPREMILQEIIPVFKNVGRVYQIRIMVDFSGSNRGFGFVRYCDVETASKALKVLKNFEIQPGNFIMVHRSVDNTRIYVGNIPRDRSVTAIKNELKDVVDGIVDIKFPSNENSDIHRGFAFVEFESHRAATIGRRKLTNCGVNIWSQALTVDWADPEPFVDDLLMSSVKILFVSNLSSSTNESKLQKIFGPDAIKVKRSRDFAFIHFNRKEIAKEVMDTWNNRIIDGLPIQISWARPKHFSYRPVNQTGNNRNNIIQVKTPSSYSQNYMWTDPYKSQLLGSKLPSFSSSYNILNELSLAKGWGQPSYDVKNEIPLEVGRGQYFLCTITIPNFYGIAKQAQFQITLQAIDAFNAREAAARNVLNYLGQLPSSRGNAEQRGPDEELFHIFPEKKYYELAQMLLPLQLDGSNK